MLANIVAASMIGFWPVNLSIHNLNAESLTYFFPAILVGVSALYFKYSKKIFLIGLLFIPFISPKLALFPLFFFLSLVFSEKEKKQMALLVLASLIILVLNFQNFRGQSIFNFDYEAQQQTIREQQLYPHPVLSRMFHNKVKIMTDKAIVNFFVLVDPNNYLFGNAPRQVLGDNQNLQKLPILSLPFVLYGLYFLQKNKYKVFIITAFTSGVLSLVVLAVADRNDFILYVPLIMLTLYGYQVFRNKFKYAHIYLLLFSAISFIEYLRIFADL